MAGGTAGAARLRYDVGSVRSRWRVSSRTSVRGVTRESGLLNGRGVACRAEEKRPIESAGNVDRNCRRGVTQ